MSAARRLLRAAAALLILAGTVEAGRIGLADFMRQPATRLVDQAGGRAARPPSPQHLDAAYRQLDEARGVDPANPLLPEYQGHVHLQRARLAAALPRVRDGYLAYARDRYLEALALRPNSAYLWASLVQVDHLLLDGADAAGRAGLAARIGLAIERAMALGGREAYVVDAVAEVGGARWELLSQAQQRLVELARLRAEKAGGRWAGRQPPAG